MNRKTQDCNIRPFYRKRSKNPDALQNFKSSYAAMFAITVAGKTNKNIALMKSCRIKKITN